MNPAATPDAPGLQSQVPQYSLAEALTPPGPDAAADFNDRGTMNDFAEGLTAAGPDGAAGGNARVASPLRPPKQELIYEGLVSYGNYKIFAGGFDEHVYTAGVEYDRHSWGYFLKSEMDYVAEVLPLVLLNKPRNVNIWGFPIPYPSGKYDRQIVPGIGFSPIGFRLQWRSKALFRPYMEVKGGMLLFAKKVPSNEATYENFNLQSCTGVQLMMSEKWGLRLGLFSDFHLSDGFIVPVNPGLDVMNANLGLSYHF